MNHGRHGRARNEKEAGKGPKPKPVFRAVRCAPWLNTLDAAKPGPSIKRTKAPPGKKKVRTEAELQQYMLKVGLMSQLPDTEADFDDPDDQPITIKGEPLSKTIIRERRRDGGLCAAKSRVPGGYTPGYSLSPPSGGWGNRERRCAVYALAFLAFTRQATVCRPRPGASDVGSGEKCYHFRGLLRTSGTVAA
jgi:hypothetical protein